MPKTFAPLPTTADILAHFTFDRAHGVLRWRGDTLSTRYLNKGLIGMPAGHVGPGGYLRVKVGGRSYLVHRLVFKLVHGRDPDGEVDHRDLDTLNNRPSNLREATSAENTWNKGNKARRTVLPKGVTFHKKSERFHARIQAHGVRQHLGSFADPDAAAQAYATASKAVHGGFGRTA